VNTKKLEVIFTWPVSSQRNGDGAFDEKTHRLFIGTRTPPQMIAMNSRTGKEVANLPTVEGMDGVSFDARISKGTLPVGRDNKVGMFSRTSRTMQIITKR